MARRRGHGEGAIFKRKANGKVVGWTAMLDLGFVNGKRKRRAFYGRERSDVQDKLDEARRKLRSGLTVGDPRLTTGAWLERWLADVAKPHVRPSTFKSIATSWRITLSPLWAASRLTASPPPMCAK